MAFNKVELVSGHDQEEKEEKEEQAPYLLNPQQLNELAYLRDRMQTFLEKNPKEYAATLEYITKFLLAHNPEQVNCCELYAYKLLFLFGNSKSVGQYLSRVNAKNLEEKEYMQYIDLKLPEDKDENTIKGLQGLLKKSSIADDPALIKNIIYYMDALKTKILEESGRDFGKKGEQRWIKAFQLPVVNKQYLSEFLVTQWYSFVTEETLEDGLVFLRHRVPENFLSMWLELKGKAGNSDLLLPPETLLVDGASIGQEELCFISMDAQDPRRAVLGHITDCCESINSKTSGGYLHVIEDTLLSTVGIVVLTKDNQDRLDRLQKPKGDPAEEEKGKEALEGKKKRGKVKEKKEAVDYGKFHLSKSCKDEDILGFMRVYLSKDKKNLVIDTAAIRSLTLNDKKKFKQIVAMIAKFSENFLNSNPQIDAVWLAYSGEAFSCQISPYFTGETDDLDTVTPPEEMHAFEGIGPKTLICNRTANDLYTTLMHSPEQALKLKKEDLAQYRIKDLLKKCIAFSHSSGGMEGLFHLISLMSKEELQEANLFKLACDEGNTEIIYHIIDTNPDLILTWPSALLTLLESSISTEKKMDILTQIFKKLDQKTRLALITAKSPDGTGNVVMNLLKQQPKETGAIVFILEQLKLQEGISLYKELIDEDPLRMGLTAILENKNHEMLNYLLSSLSPDEISHFFRVLPSKGGTILSHCQDLETLKLILEDKRISKETKLFLVLTDRGPNLICSNILTACKQDPRMLSYLFKESDLLQEEEKISFLHRPMRLGMGRESSILHYYSIDSDEGIAALTELFSLPPTYRLTEMLFKENEKGMTPIEYSMEGTTTPEMLHFLLEKMAEDKQAFLSFMKHSGCKIVDICPEKYRLALIEMIASISQKQGMDIPYSWYISKKSYSQPKELSALYMEFLSKEALPVLKEEKQGTKYVILSDIYRTLLAVNKIMKSNEIALFDSLKTLFNNIKAIEDDPDEAKVVKKITTLLNTWEMENRPNGRLQKLFSSAQSFFSPESATHEIIKMLDIIHKKIPTHKANPSSTFG